MLYRNQTKYMAKQTIQVTVSGTPQNYELFDGNCVNTGEDSCTTQGQSMAPTTANTFTLPYDAFTQGPDDILVYSADTGSLTLTFTDLSNPSVAPVSQTINFTN